MGYTLDVSGIGNAILSKQQDELENLYGEIVDLVETTHHLDIKAPERTQIVHLMKTRGISARVKRAAPQVIKLHREVTRVGKRDEYVGLFIDKGEIDSTKFSDPVRQSMINYLITRGTEFHKGKENDIETAITTGNYDEHFFAAYDHALRVSSGQLDPLVTTQGDTSDEPELWDFTVASFDGMEEKGIIPENVRAAGAIDFICELGERLGIFNIVDAIVLNWSSGVIDVVEGPSAAKLYTYWKRRDERCSPEERGMLYKRILNKGDASVLERMVVNVHFGGLWGKLMTETAKYIEKTEQINDGISETSPVSRRGIYQATRELQYNLTEHCTGMAHMKTREVYAQLKDAMEILDDENIKAHFGGSRRKSMWTVIELISKQEFGHSPNIGAHQSLAENGNKIFKWLADFSEGSTPYDAFLDFVYAAESYIITAADATTDDEQFDDEKQEDEFADSEFEDEFEDF